MYLTHIFTNESAAPMFILVLPFEEKDFARTCGFTWGNPQPGAWATYSITVACQPIKRCTLSDRAVFLSVDPATLDYIKEHTAMTDTTYEAMKAAYTEPTRKEKAGIAAATMTDAQAQAVHQALQSLAAVCDGAVSDDRAGFNRNDLEYGHSLAAAPELSRSQAGYGKLLLQKYRKQLGDDLYAVIFPELLAADRAAADAKAQAKADKLHAKSKPCTWEGCQLQDCMLSQGRATVIGNEVVETAKSIYSSPEPPAWASTPSCGAVATVKLAKRELTPLQQPQPIGHTDESGTPVVTRPEAVVVVQTEDAPADEVTKLAHSLATCNPGDFDTTVDLLRALRKIDEPKKAGSEFAAAAWTAAGYQVAK